MSSPYLSGRRTLIHVLEVPLPSLRRTYLNLEGQLVPDGIDASPEELVAEASCAKNILLNHDLFAPYSGLLERHPRDFGTAMSDKMCNISDGDSGKIGILSDTVTVRERASEVILHTIVM